MLELVEQDKSYKPELLQQLTFPTLVLWTRYNPDQLMPPAEQGAVLILDSD